MKKYIKYSIIFLSILCGVLIVNSFGKIGFLLFSSRNEESDMQLNSQLTQEALEKSDITICKKVSTGYLMSGANPRGNCTERVILKTRDYTLCNSVNMKEYQMNRDQCYVVVSEVVDDIKVCENISPKNLMQKGTCIGNISRNNHNIDVCKNQKDGEVKRVCLIEYSEEEDVAANYLLTLTGLPPDIYIRNERIQYPDSGIVQFIVSSKKDIYYSRYVRLKKDSQGIWQVIYFGEEQISGNEN